MMRRGRPRPVAGRRVVAATLATIAAGVGLTSAEVFLLILMSPGATPADYAFGIMTVLFPFVFGAFCIGVIGPGLLLWAGLRRLGATRPWQGALAGGALTTLGMLLLFLDSGWSNAIWHAAFGLLPGAVGGWIFMSIVYAKPRPTPVVNLSEGAVDR